VKVEKDSAFTLGMFEIYGIEIRGEG